MNWLSLIDIHFLLSVGIIFGVFVLFYRIQDKRQRGIMMKIELSLKLQEQALQQAGLMLNELKRTNRLLGELSPEAQESMHNKSSDNADMGDEEDGHSKLYVGNIDYAATEEELAAHFASYGKIEFVNIPVNRYTGRARGFGFVTFTVLEDAERAMELHGSDFKGRPIQVNFAKERMNA